MIYNRFFHYSERLGTTPLREFNENIHESWNNASSDSESQISHVKTEKCPTNILRKFKKHESVNLIRLKQNAKQKTLTENRNKKNRRDNQKGRKRIRNGSANASRRDSKGRQNTRCDHRLGSRKNRWYFLPIPPTSRTS